MRGKWWMRANWINFPMILNEFDPFRCITHFQIKTNPIGVQIAGKHFLSKIGKFVDQFHNGDVFVIQNQKWGYRPIKADATARGLRKIDIGLNSNNFMLTFFCINLNFDAVSDLQANE
jgi:hypothetical protein